jgi:hypothetical protein
VAKTPGEIEVVNNSLLNAQHFAEAQESNHESQRLMEEAKAASAGGAEEEPVTPRLTHRKEFVPSGPHRFVVGILKAVQCDAPDLDLTVSSGSKTLALHTDNYYKIQFTALNFQPNGELKPCTDLEDRPAKVEYVESSDKNDTPRLIAIELHK